MGARNAFERNLERRIEDRHELYTSLKAKADAKRSMPEKIADAIMERLGSLTFLAINLTAYSLWMFINVGIIPGFTPIDPYPFGFMTMLASLQALIITIVVLVSQNRASKVADLRQEVDLQMVVKTEAELTKLMEMVKALLEKHEINVSNDYLLQEMLQPTDVEKLQQLLEDEVIGKDD